MRLIDADELLKQIKYKPIPNILSETWNELYERVIEEIDNAPTVAESCKKLQEVANERPNGKWTRIPCKYVIWQCSNCNNFSENWTSFCCWCGADMRGGDNHVAI